jgi:hypothetical protein
MTPEELNRTIEFIIQSQARLAAAQEQDREDRLKLEEWSKGLFSRLSLLSEQQTRLSDHQSQRMDRYDEWLRQNADFQRQALRLLNSILDRLPPPNPN